MTDKTYDFANNDGNCAAWEMALDDDNAPKDKAQDKSFVWGGQGENAALKDTDIANISTENDIVFHSTDWGVGDTPALKCKFYITEKHDGIEISKISAYWRGKVDGAQGYDLSFCIFNRSTSKWELLQEVNITNAGTYYTASGEKTTNINNYFNNATSFDSAPTGDGDYCWLGFNYCKASDDFDTDYVKVTISYATTSAISEDIDAVFTAREVKTYPLDLITLGRFKKEQLMDSILDIIGWGEVKSYPIAETADDTYCTPSINYYDQPEITFSSGKRAYFRWDVDIPKISYIRNAFIEMQASEDQSGDMEVDIDRLVSGSPNFVANPWDRDIVSGETQKWNVPDFEFGEDYNTVTITSSVQNFIDSMDYEDSGWIAFRFKVVV